jgi:transcriptional regulator with XRE-family HTH domain
LPGAVKDALDRQELQRSVDPGIGDPWLVCRRPGTLGCVDRPGLADFLKRRRDALQPIDVGMAPGLRRRTIGLRREEVATLASMSTDYYARLEQQRAPQPSEQMVASIARALRLTLDERDHLFRLSGHTAPTRTIRSDHISPGLMRVLDRLDDTPAQVISDIAETLAQNRLAIALLGDQSRFEGYARSAAYRWYTDPRERLIYPEADRELQAGILVANLRVSATRGGPNGRAAAVAQRLHQDSAEFARIWDRHDVTGRTDETKTIVHPELGPIHLNCQILFTQDGGQALLVFTAAPGSEDHSKLQMLSVLGTQHLA